MVGLSYLTDVF